MISSPPIGPFPFSLTPAQAKATKDAVFGGPQRTFWMYGLLFGSIVLQIPNMIVLMLGHGWRVESFAVAVLELFVAAAVTALAIVFVRQRRRPIPLTGSLTFADGGFEGILDGSPTTIRWNEIAGAQDLDTAIVIRRRLGGLIALPKADVDGPALWSLLEDHLISKRGLIRSASARRIIANTAC
jgi:hypothetical protein